MSRTLASFLADRPENELNEMLAAVQETRERMREEERRLAVEEALISDALSRQSRRSPAANSGSARINRGQVLRILAQHGKPVTIAEAVELVRNVHAGVSRAAVRAHMHRLKEQDKLIQSGRQWFVSPSVTLGWDAAGEVVDAEPLRPDGQLLPASFPAEFSAGRTSPNPEATGEGENREMSPLAGSRDGPGKP